MFRNVTIARRISELSVRDRSSDTSEKKKSLALSQELVKCCSSAYPIIYNVSYPNIF